MAVLASLCVVLGLAAGPAAARLTEIAMPLVGEAVGAPAGSSTAVTGAVAMPLTPDVSSVAGAVTPIGLAVLGALLALAGLAGLRRGRRRDAARVSPTWTCGMVADATMEYTASSYSNLLRQFFRRVLLPGREIHVEYHPGTPLPSTMRYRGEVTHVLEQHVFGPLHALAVRSSSTIRRLQNGSVQAYLGYALIGLVVLLALAR
jgi:hydrogenase-4 component B